jgi:hypothetical protein
MQLLACYGDPIRALHGVRCCQCADMSHRQYQTGHNITTLKQTTKPQ